MTITLTREEAQQVLDVLNDVRYRIEFGQMNLSDDTDAAIETLRTRLAQPEPEPVAYRVWGRMGSISFRHTKPHESEYVEWDELYTAPPQREWRGLTDQEVLHIIWSSAEDSKNTGRFEYFFARAIEAKLKEKNA
jgi:hypothetical protein